MRKQIDMLNGTRIRFGLTTMIIRLLAVIAMAMIASPASAVTMTDIGELYSPIGRSIPTGFNNAGQIIGYSYANMENHAFLWQNGVMTDLGTLGGYYSFPNDINERGQVVGYAMTADSDHAFLWQDGVMTDLGTLGGWDSYAGAINDSGQVIGRSLIGPIRGSGVPVYSFFWENGVMTNLGSSFSAVGITNQNVVGIRSDAAGNRYISTWQEGVITDIAALGTRTFRPVLVNQAGQMAGYCTQGGTSSACFWNGTEFVDLKGNNVRLGGISPKGHIVGQSVTASGETHAFLWKDGVMTDLGTLGGNYSRALAVNGSGQVVGDSATSSRKTHAFYWENGSMSDLGTLGSTYDDYSSAFLINEGGDAVGYSYPALGGDLHGVLWTVKSPAELIAALIALKDGYNFEKSISISLGELLQNAQKWIDDEQSKTACNLLGAFIHLTEARTGKGIAADQAAWMAQKAHDIERLLNCK